MSKKILLIDDDAVGANLLSQLLQYMGYNVFPLERVDRIFTEITKCQPDLILLYDTLSTINSGVVERCIHAVESSSRIPVIKFSESDYVSFSSLLTNQENAKNIFGLNAFIQKIEHSFAA